jgi:polysaccharide biosynthesis transport protein
VRRVDAKKGETVSQIIEDERPQLLSRSLRRYAAVVLLLALLAGAGAAAYAASRPEVYTSSARILLRPSTGNPYSVETGPSSQQVTIAMTTEAALVNSDPVLSLVNAKMSPDLSPTDVTVTVPANTSTIVARVQAASATRAQQGAQAVADGYLAYREQVTSATRKASVDQLTKQITTVQSDLAGASDKASKLPADSQSARQAQVLTEQLISLQDLANTARSIDTDPGTLVSPAATGTRTGISATLIIGAGIAIGLLLGIVLALYLGRRDRRVHAEAGASVAGVPVLAVLKGRAGAAGETADRQAYQRLRTSVLASSALPSAVAVSGVGAKDTSSPVALELGRSMVRAGYRVVLVMASAEEAGPFPEDNRGARGLADALREGRKVADLHLLVQHEGLAVLSAGSGILDQQELLSGERFARVVTELKSAFDYVLVVTGPAVLPAELATARLADALLLVGRDGVTSRIDIGDVSARARLVGLRVSGLVLRSRQSRAGSAGHKAPARTPGQERPQDSKDSKDGDGIDGPAPDSQDRPGELRKAAERT